MAVHTLVSLMLLGATVITPGARETRTAGAKPTAFEIELKAGDVASLSVEQRSSDLAVRLRTPNGVIHRFDGFDSGVEPIVYLAVENGRHSIEVDKSAQAGAAAAFTLEYLSLSGDSVPNRTLVDAVQSSSRAKELYVAGKTVGAICESERAAFLWSQANKPILQARMLVRKGEVLYGSEQWEEARASFRDALRIAERIGDDSLLAEGFNNAGLCSRWIGDIDEATASLNNALAIFRRLGDWKGTAATQTNRALLLSQAGEFGRSILEYRQALKVFQDLPNERLNQALVLSNLAIPYVAIGKYDAAISCLNESMRLLPAGQDVVRGRIFSNMGYAFRGMGDQEQAERSLLQARDLLRNSSARASYADTLLQLGIVLAERRAIPDGLNNVKDALAIYREMQDRRGTAHAVYYKGVAELSQRDLLVAETDLAASLDLRETLVMPDAAALSRWQLGRAAAARGRTDQAAEFFEKATSSVEGLRVRIAGDPFRTGYFSRKQRIFDDYIQLLMREGKASAALEVAERSLARGLSDLLAESSTSVNGVRDVRGVDPKLQNELESERRRLNYLAGRASALASTNPSSDRARQAKALLEESIANYHALESRLRAESPRFYSFAWPQAAKFHEIQEGLDKDTTLLEYWLGDEASHLWMVTRESVRTFSLPRKALVKTAVTALRAAAATRDEHRVEHAFRRLSGILIPFKAADVRGRKLLVVRTADLDFVPMNGLFVEGHMLGSMCPVSFVPSASAMSLLQTRVTISSQPMVVLADPVVDPADDRTDLSETLRVKISADAPARLLMTRQLAYRVKQLQPETRLFLDFDASKARFLGPTMKNFRIVELDAHIRVDANPELSGIVLSLTRKDGTSIDGIVRQNDIMARAELNADLVILNGCSGALGKEVAGEGLQSLVRALFYAGARRVLASHFDLEQGDGFEFLSRYHKILLGGRAATAGRALQLTQAEMCNHPQTRYRNPLYAAAFSLYGDQ